MSFICFINYYYILILFKFINFLGYLKIGFILIEGPEVVPEGTCLTMTSAPTRDTPPVPETTPTMLPVVKTYRNTATGKIVIITNLTIRFIESDSLVSMGNMVFLPVADFNQEYRNNILI